MWAETVGMTEPSDTGTVIVPRPDAGSGGRCDPAGIPYVSRAHLERLVPIFRTSAGVTPRRTLRVYEGGLRGRMQG